MSTHNYKCRQNNNEDWVVKWVQPIKISNSTKLKLRSCNFSLWLIPIDNIHHQVQDLRIKLELEMNFNFPLKGVIVYNYAAKSTLYPPWYSIPPSSNTTTGNHNKNPITSFLNSTNYGSTLGQTKHNYLNTLSFIPSLVFFNFTVNANA